MWEQMGYVFLPVKTSTVRARIEPTLKLEVEAILASLGLTASEAIQLLYRQIKLRNALPFAVEMPDESTGKPLPEIKSTKDEKPSEGATDFYAEIPL